MHDDDDDDEADAAAATTTTTKNPGARARLPPYLTQLLIGLNKQNSHH